MDKELVAGFDDNTPKPDSNPQAGVAVSQMAVGGVEALAGTAKKAGQEVSKPKDEFLAGLEKDIAGMVTGTKEAGESIFEKF